MKKILLLLLLMPLMCFAEKDYCKKIKKTTDKNNAVFYKSPDLKHASVLRSYTVNPFFLVLFHAKTDKEHFDRKGIIVVFADGTTIVDEEAKVVCNEAGYVFDSAHERSSISYSGSYLLQAYLHITDENLGKLTSVPIETIIIDNVPEHIDGKEARQLIGYVNCLKDNIRKEQH